MGVPVTYSSFPHHGTYTEISLGSQERDDGFSNTDVYL